MSYYPKMNVQRTSRIVTDVFAGYNHQMKIQDGEWYDTKNISTLRFPMFSPRPPRGTLNISFTNLQAIIAKDALYWVDNGTLYANGYATGLTGLQTQQDTQLVSMGAYICIFPDKKYINTMNLSDFGDMGASVTIAEGGSVRYSMCHQDGTVCENVVSGPAEPSQPVNNMVWVDTSEGKTVKEYSTYTASWTVLETVYTRVDFISAAEGTITGRFKEYDGVEIEGMSNDDLNGSKVLYAVGTDGTSGKDFIVIIGIQGTASTETLSEALTIRREIPDMNYVCEAQNRLWGCYYGNDGTQNLNEIYCCALGDFKNWSQYLGISTDSWRGSIGSDGPWTGCINYMGAPTFFKENVIHQVSVSSAGAHQIAELPARGVQQGSSRSLAVVNETLYYKARAGIMAYQGGMPAEVGAALGEERYYSAVAGAFGDKYCISMKDSADTWHFFCYDVKKGLWMHEDALHAEMFAAWGDELYAQAQNRILALNGTEGTPEQSVEWHAVTGLQYYRYPDQKYVSRYNIRLSMAQGSQMRIKIEYDSSGTWELYGSVTVQNTGTCTIPVRPRRCDHMRLRLEGSGDVRIFSIARILEQGSDV